MALPWVKVAGPELLMRLDSTASLLVENVVPSLLAEELVAMFATAFGIIPWFPCNRVVVYGCTEDAPPCFIFSGFKFKYYLLLDG